MVLDDERVINPEGLRMPDEFVRHKVLDAVGDLALAGRVACVESIAQDYEDKIQLAVTVEDDPGKDLGFRRACAGRFAASSPNHQHSEADSEHGSERNASGHAVE